MPLILGPDRPAFEFLKGIRSHFEILRGRIIVAWARTGGVGLLLKALGTDVQRVQLVVGMAGAATSAEALAHLRASCERVYLFHKHPRQTFHPKVYYFDSGEDPPERSALLVGSSNLTGGGLFSNFEASITANLSPASVNDHRETHDSVTVAFDELVASKFCEEISTDERIRQLLADRYLSTEAKLRKRSSEDAKQAPKHGRRRAKPESPPPPLPPFALPELATTFAEPGSSSTPKAPPPSSAAAAHPLTPGPAPIEAHTIPFVADGRFFVRTLTGNDVNKILDAQTGTFEPDLTVSARNELPEFWGWPDRFVQVTRRESRHEWATAAVIHSTKTGPTGIDVEFMQWFRPYRPANQALKQKSHAAEHRFRIGPISKVREAVPDGFDEDGLVVIERLPEGAARDFRVMLIASIDPEYPDFSSYLNRKKPRHSYGYGPDELSD